MTNLPFIRYARVSSVGGRSGDRYISIPLQTKTMDGLARENGVTVHPDLFRDEDCSGGNVDRPEFQRALDLIRQGKAGGILVATFDRFSRNVEDALSTIREIEAAGGRLLCGDGNVSMSNGSDAFMATVRAAVSAFERARRAEYLDKSVASAIERGVHLSAPFGYVKSNGRGSKLAVHPDEAPIVRLMFDARADGHSWGAVADAANESGVMPRPHKRDGVTKRGRWTHKTVRQIVRSEVYTGVAFNGSRRHPGAHDAIVTDELFAAGNRAKGVKSIRSTEGFLLTGLGRCSLCGYALIHFGHGDRCYYRCQYDGCGQMSVPAGQLEELVVDRFRDEFLDVDPVDGMATDDAVITAEAEFAAARARVAGLIEMAGGLGDLSPVERELFDDQMRDARAALANAESSLRAANQALHGAELPTDLDAAAFDALSVPERRRLLGVVYAAVVVRPAAVWREPVARRFTMLGREQAPTNGTALIAHVAGLAA